MHGGQQTLDFAMEYYRKVDRLLIQREARMSQLRVPRVYPNLEGLFRYLR